MGDQNSQPFQPSFNGLLEIDFQGSRVTSDGGRIPVRELDEFLGFGDLIAQRLNDSRHGKNTQRPLADLLRQPVYGRIAGYEDVNDAERLSQDPTYPLIGSEKIWEWGVKYAEALAYWRECDDFGAGLGSSMRYWRQQFRMNVLIGASLRGTLLATVTVMAAWAEQGPDRPRFAVTSVRPVPSGAPIVYFAADFRPVRPGGQYINPRASLAEMISLAYEIDTPAVRLLGVPKWAKSQPYDVAAKPDSGFPKLSEAENLTQVRLMMRGLLQERFGLKIHSEARPGPVLSMEIAKSGIKMKKVSAPSGRGSEGRVDLALDDVGGRLLTRGCTMSALANTLSVFLQRPVVDRTGLAGFFAFDIRWSEPDNSGAEALSSGVGTVGLGLLTSNVRQQLGLQVRKTNGVVDYWVVDDVKAPSPN